MAQRDHHLCPHRETQRLRCPQLSQWQSPHELSDHRTDLHRRRSDRHRVPLLRRRRQHAEGARRNDRHEGSAAITVRSAAARRWAWLNPIVTAGKISRRRVCSRAKPPTSAIPSSSKPRSWSPKYGNVVSNIGTTVTAKVTKKGGAGTLANNTKIAIPTTGLAESSAATPFEYTSPGKARTKPSESGDGKRHRLHRSHGGNRILGGPRRGLLRAARCRRSSATDELRGHRSGDRGTGAGAVSAESLARAATRWPRWRTWRAAATGAWCDVRWAADRSASTSSTSPRASRFPSTTSSTATRRRSSSSPPATVDGDRRHHPPAPAGTFVRVDPQPRLHCPQRRRRGRLGAIVSPSRTSGYRPMEWA